MVIGDRRRRTATVPGELTIACVAKESWAPAPPGQSYVADAVAGRPAGRGRIRESRRFRARRSDTRRLLITGPTADKAGAWRPMLSRG